MRISDWSSDVCSSDLKFAPIHRIGRALASGIGRLRQIATLLPGSGQTLTRHQQPASLLHLGVEPVDEGADARLRRDVAVERQPEAAPDRLVGAHADQRSEEHTSELQSLMRISYAVFCLKKKK